MALTNSGYFFSNSTVLYLSIDIWLVVVYFKTTRVRIFSRRTPSKVLCNLKINEVKVILVPLGEDITTASVPKYTSLSIASFSDGYKV